MGQYQTRVIKSSEGDQEEQGIRAIGEAQAIGEARETRAPSIPSPVFGSPIECELNQMDR